MYLEKNMTKLLLSRWIAYNCFWNIKHIHWNRVGAATLHKNEEFFYYCLWKLDGHNLILLSSHTFSTGMYSELWGEHNSHWKEQLNEADYTILCFLLSTLAPTWINLALLYCMWSIYKCVWNYWNIAEFVSVHSATESCLLKSIFTFE